MLRLNAPPSPKNQKKINKRLERFNKRLERLIEALRYQNAHLKTVSGQ